MRKPNMSDTFRFARALKECGAKEKITKSLNEYSSTNEQDSIGFLFDLMSIFCDARLEKDLYSILAGIFEVTAEDVESMHPLDVIKCIQECDDWSNWLTFFGQSFK